MPPPYGGGGIIIINAAELQSNVSLTAVESQSKSNRSGNYRLSYGVVTQ